MFFLIFTTSVYIAAHMR